MPLEKGDSSAGVLGGGGELGRRMRELDWATTPLGSGRIVVSPAGSSARTAAQRIFGERQQALLREVAAKTASARSVAEACELALSAFATNPKDLPFALLYLAKGSDVELVATAGFPPDHPLIVDNSTTVWPIRDVLDGALLGRRDLEGLG